MKQSSMKNIVLLLLCFVSVSPVLRAQRVESLRFVYAGEEDKPHGTLVISIGKYMKPTDRGVVDSNFGKCVLTDIRTFDSLRQFILHSKYPIRRFARITDSLDRWLQEGYSYYTIIGSDGSVVYLNGKYWISFFDGLKVELRAHELDPRVIGAF
jgi:hypothetical protein